MALSWSLRGTGAAGLAQLVAVCTGMLASVCATVGSRSSAVARSGSSGTRRPPPSLTKSAGSDSPGSIPDIIVNGACALIPDSCSQIIPSVATPVASGPRCASTRSAPSRK